MCRKSILLEIDIFVLPMDYGDLSHLSGISSRSRKLREPILDARSGCSVCDLSNLILTYPVDWGDKSVNPTSNQTISHWISK